MTITLGTAADALDFPLTPQTVRARRAMTVAAQKTMHQFVGLAESNGTDVAANSVFRVKVLKTADRLAVRFDNVKTLGQAPASNAIQVSAAVRKNGTYYRVYFGTDTFGRVPVDGHIHGVATLAVTEGDWIEVLTFVEPRDSAGTLIASGKWPTFSVPTAIFGEYAENVTSGATDKTMAGGFTGSPAAAFGPSAVLALDLPQTKHQQCFCGDSITTGANSSDFMGYPGVVAGDGPFFNLGIYGESVSTIVSTPAQFEERLAICGLCDIVGTLYGSNDGANLRTAAQIEGDLSTLWQRIYATTAPLIWAGTLLPRSTSSDSFATVANQTVASWEAVRVAVNTWLRAGAPLDPTTLVPVAVGTVGAKLAGQTGHPLWKVIDTASAVESSADSGKWAVPAAPLPRLTSEGSHPEQPGYEAIGAVIAPHIGLTLTTPPSTPPPAAYQVASAPRTAQLALVPSMFLRLNELSGAVAYDQTEKHGGQIYGPVTYGVTGPGTDADKGMTFASGAFVKVPEHPDFRRLTGLSLLVWVKVASVASTQVMMHLSPSSTVAGFTWQIHAVNGFMNFKVNNGNVFDNAGGGVIPLSVWTRVGVSYAAGGAVRFYVNGAATASTNSGGPPAGSPAGRAPAGHPLTLGTDHTSVFVGSMKDALYLPRVLTPTEFSDDYANR